MAGGKLKFEVEQAAQSMPAASASNKAEMMIASDEKGDAAVSPMIDDTNYEYVEGDEEVADELTSSAPAAAAAASSNQQGHSSSSKSRKRKPASDPPRVDPEPPADNSRSSSRSSALVPLATPQSTRGLKKRLKRHSLATDD
jgi:hypothetical protein